MRGFTEIKFDLLPAYHSIIGSPQFMMMRFFVRSMQAASVGALLFSNALAQDAAAKVDPALKYKMDGSFEDWKSYRTGWKNSIYPKGLTKAGAAGPADASSTEIRDFHFDNDATYLYLFFKCDPPPLEHKDGSSSPIHLGAAYIDSDKDPKTGSPRWDADHCMLHEGADLLIDFNAGVYWQIRGLTSSSGKFITYSVRRWHAESNRFAKATKETESRSDSPLIALGAHGIEVAIPLADLNLQKGSKFDFVYRQGLDRAKVPMEIQ